MARDRQFPIQATNCDDGKPATIDWSVAEIAVAEHQRRVGVAMSIDEYARRGGFGVWELADLLGSAFRRSNAFTKPPP